MVAQIPNSVGEIQTISCLSLSHPGFWMLLQNRAADASISVTTAAGPLLLGSQAPEPHESVVAACTGPAARLQWQYCFQLAHVRVIEAKFEGG